KKIRDSSPRLLPNELEIIRFVAGFPFDVATDAGFLAGGSGLVGEDGVEGFAQIFPGHGLSIARAAVVELAAVDEAMVFVEEIKIWRAGGAIIFGDGLGGVVEVWEIVSGSLCFLLHLVRAVLWIVVHVVGTDGDDGGAARSVIASELGEPAANMFHIRAMIA